MVKGHILPIDMPPYHEDVYACESVVSFDSFEDDIKDNVKRKTRNLSEKKRRDQFNMLVNELCSMVSINNKKMDKSTVLKSTIAFLKTHQEIAVKSQIHEIKEDWKPSFLSNDEFSHLMLEALDSFLIVFTIKGKILYVSESVTSLLGHLPNDLVRKSLYHFLHEYDREKVTNLLRNFQTTCKATEDFGREVNQIRFQCHMQCGSINKDDAKVYEAVEVTGTCRPWDSDDDGQIDSEGYIYMRSPTADTTCLCCTVRLQTTKIIREMPTCNEPATEFTSRHSLGWKFLFLDHRAPPVIGYLPFEVLGTSGYDYYHPDDLDKIAKCHEQLMKTGEGTSCHYRFLTKGQQWIWLTTRYYITYHQWNSKPEFIVCTNTVVSYSDVRSSMRKVLGQDVEDDVDMDDAEMEMDQSPPSSVTSGPSSVTSGSSSITSDPSSVTSGPSSVTSGPSSVTSGPSSVTSGPSSVTSGPSPVILQPLTPEVANDCQPEGSDSLKLPHTTQLEMANPSMPQQLQTFIQQQPQLPQQPPAPPPPQPQPAPPSQNVIHSAIVPPTAVPMSAARNMVPVNMTNTPHNMLNLQHKQLVVPSTGESVGVVPSLSPNLEEPQERQQIPQLFMQPTQRMFHDQLMHKSEQLQDAIRHQQEELRQITEQLTHAPVIHAMGDNSGQQVMLQSHLQHMGVPPSQMMMMQQMKTLDMMKQQQHAVQLYHRTQLQHAQLQQVHHQLQMQPCLPFQIVPDSEDVGFSRGDMTEG